MSLLSSLCLSLETEGTSKDASGESSSDDDDFGGKADELGLGGAALKGIMDVMNAKQGVVPGSDIPAGEVIGGEVLGIICERESTMSGYVPLQRARMRLMLVIRRPRRYIRLYWNMRLSLTAGC